MKRKGYNQHEKRLIEIARELKAGDGSNPEYDRALVNVVTDFLGKTQDDQFVVAQMLGIPWFDRTWFHDYVVAHGFGAPTERGYKLGRTMIEKDGDDYATAAFEVVYRGLTKDA
jgi:hypothetical protein